MLADNRVSVYLSKEEVDLAKFMASMRNINESHFGPQTYGGKNSYQAHLEGALGEVAVCRYYDIRPDLVFMDKGGGAAIDAVIDGQTVEIKTRPFYKDFYMMVAKHTFKHADLYIACAVDVSNPRYVELVGCATGDQVAAIEPCRPFGISKLPLTYMVPERMLQAPPPRPKTSLFLTMSDFE